MWRLRVIYELVNESREPEILEVFEDGFQTREAALKRYWEILRNGAATETGHVAAETIKRIVIVRDHR